LCLACSVGIAHVELLFQSLVVCFNWSSVWEEVWMMQLEKEGSDDGFAEEGVAPAPTAPQCENAGIPVAARPRMSAWMLLVPS